jgi:hypothetical protein
MSNNKEGEIKPAAPVKKQEVDPKNKKNQKKEEKDELVRCNSLATSNLHFNLL